MDTGQRYPRRVHLSQTAVTHCRSLGLSDPEPGCSMHLQTNQHDHELTPKAWGPSGQRSSTLLQASAQGVMESQIIRIDAVKAQNIPLNTRISQVNIQPLYSSFLSPFFYNFNGLHHNIFICAYNELQSYSPSHPLSFSPPTGLPSISPPFVFMSFFILFL
jgi:hypothetical protein